METKKHFWSVFTDHSLAWTNALVALIVLASLRQPNWHYVLGSAILAGAIATLSAILRNGFTWGKIVHFFGATLGSVLFSAVAFYFILPMGQLAVVWNNILPITVFGIAIVRVVWLTESHGTVVPVAGVIDSAGAGEATTVAAKTWRVPHRARKIVTTIILASLLGGWLITANEWRLFYLSQVE